MWKLFLEDYGDPLFKGFNLSALAVDEAYLQFTSSFDSNLTVYQRSSLCVQCPYQKAFGLEAGENKTLKYETNSYWNFLFSSSDQDFVNPSHSKNEICSVENLSMGEFGVYELNVNPSYCDFKVLKPPVFIYGGLVLAFVFYLALAISCSLIKCIRSTIKRRKENQIEQNSYVVNENNMKLDFTESRENDQNKSSKRTRLQSLDTFRGITIILMILVNHGGGKYWFLEHAPWNGLRVADLVFPWFLWIMGVCIPMGVRSQLKRKVPKRKILLRFLERSIKLFAIGIILNTVGGHNQLERIRIPGVLQRFAVSYFVTSSIYLLCISSVGKDPVGGVLKTVGDIVVLFPQWVIYILIIIGHTVFVFYMPNPRCPRGYLGPGGIVLLQNGQPSPDCIGGIARVVDIWLVGNNHIYQNPTAKSIYGSSAFDPEGILGCIPTLVQVFLGIQAGQILLVFSAPKSRLIRWVTWGLLTLFFGLILCSGIIVGGPIPVNKNLWSLSYVLITSSSAFFLLAACYLFIDAFKLWNGTPFYQTGMNSILLYVGHYMTYNVFPWRYRYGNMNSHLALFTEALWGTTLWVIIALYLFKKKKFFTV